VGAIKPTSGTASDIKQTTPATILDPTYLASPGIQVGPGTDLVTKTAGDRGFSTYIYPTTVYYGLKGNVNSANQTGYLWPGTQKASNDFPDTHGPPYAYYRAQQSCLISGLSVGLNVGPGGTDQVTISIWYTPLNGSITSTPFTVTLSGSTLTGSFYGASVHLNAGDRMHVKIVYTGNNGNDAHDVTVQVDMF
jgi:hypothetical protein